MNTYRVIATTQDYEWYGAKESWTPGQQGRWKPKGGTEFCVGVIDSEDRELFLNDPKAVVEAHRIVMANRRIHNPFGVYSRSHLLDLSFVREGDSTPYECDQLRWYGEIRYPIETIPLL